MDRKLGGVIAVAALALFASPAFSMSVESYMALRDSVTAAMTKEEREIASHTLSAYFQGVGETLENLEMAGVINASGAKICKAKSVRLRGDLVRAAADAEIVRWQDGTRDIKIIPDWKNRTVSEFAVFGLTVMFPCASPH